MSDTLETREIDLGNRFDVIEINGVKYDANGNVIVEAPAVKPKEKEIVKPTETQTVENDIELTSATENVKAVELNGNIHPIEDEVARAIAEEVSSQMSTEKEERTDSDANLLNLIQNEASAREAEDTRLSELITTEVQAGLEAEIQARTEANEALQNSINSEAQTRSEADTALQANITAEAESRAGDISYLQSELSALNTLLSTIQSRVNEINALIPEQATDENQLTDKDFVNSSIATNTANFIDTFNSLAELEAYSGTKTNNDYAFVKATDSAGNVVYKRYKWSSTDNEWKYEYDLNNSSFTAEQWEAINSGISSTIVEQVATNTTDIGNKVDKVNGKGLSANDFTSALKTKLEGIASGAEVNVQSDWNTEDTTADSFIKNKPTIPTVPTDIVKYSAQTLTTEQKSQARSNIGAGTSSFSGSYNDLSNKPSAVLYTAQTLNDTQKSQARSNIGAGTSSFSGSYNDLTNKPTIPSVDGKLNVNGSNATAAGTSKSISTLTSGDSDVVDNTELITSHINGYSTTNPSFYKRKVSYLWNYIKGKLSSVFGYSATNGYPKGIQTLKQDGSAFYGDSYSTYWQWESDTVVTAKNGSYSTKVDIATSATDALYYGTCDTSRATNAKVITCSTFALKTGARIVVKFTDTAGSAPTSGNITFNINSTGAKNVYNKDGSQLTYFSSGEFRAGHYCLITYDGTNYVWLNYNSNTTYSTITQAEIDAGTSTSSRLVTPKLLNDNFAKKSVIQSKVSKLGSTTKPLYTSADGTFAECSTYAGGTKVTLNGKPKGGEDALLYAPTSSGTTADILTATTNGAPVWKKPSDVFNGITSFTTKSITFSTGHVLSWE